MVAELLAPPLVRCSKCRQLDDLSQMQGFGANVLCGPCWPAKARQWHQAEEGRKEQ